MCRITMGGVACKEVPEGDWKMIRTKAWSVSFVLVTFLITLM